MFSDTDPRSWNYPRKYSRPPLRPVRVFFCLMLFLGLNVIVYKISQHPLICLSVSALVIMIGFRYIIIWAVKCYQHFAPIRVRAMCRFEPSCSEYMILSVKKYGVIKGVRLGVNRISRCGKMDGGFDYP